MADNGMYFYNDYVMRFLFLVMMLFSTSLGAQNINSAFVSMPDSLSPLLTKVNRQDFADFLASGMKAVVKNKFGGESEMLKLTEDYLYLKTTASSSEEMKMLPLNDSVNIICVVKTYLGPVEDSDVKFYTTEWKELPVDKHISLPVLSDFYVSENDSLAGFKDMLVYKAELSEKDNTMRFLFRSLDVTDKKTSEKLSDSVKKTLKYSWVNGRYEMNR